MTLYTIDQNGKFAEYNENANGSGKKKLDIISLIENNPESILNRSGALMIGKEVVLNENESFDLLAIDDNGNSILFDIQKGESSRDSLLKLIEKAALLDKLEYSNLNEYFCTYIEDESADLEKAHYDLFGNDVEDWNTNTKIILVSKRITEEVANTATYFRKVGLDISCIEFKYFINDDGVKMVSKEIIVGTESMQRPVICGKVSSAPKTDKEAFFGSLDRFGKVVFKQVFQFASEKGLEFHWTSKGFSLNIVVEDKAIGLCYGYAQDSLLNQSIYTGFDQISKNVKNADEIVAVYENRIDQLDFFLKKRSGYRWEITAAYTEAEINNFLEILIEVALMIKENGLIEIEADALSF